ncbi:AlpA family phage regulatory protein [Rhizobium cremeum]|uniref:helix-turn-helix transcriptional regulator n=1 Tax=Rhizobium cremeum TaxID=2813827 RepID=UPI001FD0148B|nr:AlpA family phage regulatory protein [Rhizobium cremeum]MCJ7995885.1 AlpA family phage regulatory protein [Rhizobium cremeum]MCJ7999640.1 AlpA family phage regulatory protein [Rhizobium cremeum]
MEAANDNKPRLMNPKEAAEATSLSRTLLTLMATEGQFPKPVQLTERRIAFVRAEVEAWIDQRIANRAQVAA